MCKMTLSPRQIFKYTKRKHETPSQSISCHSLIRKRTDSQSVPIISMTLLGINGKQNDRIIHKLWKRLRAELPNTNRVWR